MTRDFLDAYLFQVNDMKRDFMDAGRTWHVIVWVLILRGGFQGVASDATRDFLGACRGTTCRAARPSGRARCGAGAGCSAITYQSLCW